MEELKPLFLFYKIFNKVFKFYINKNYSHILEIVTILSIKILN